MAATNRLLLLLAWMPTLLWAAVLPQDQADMMYHSYQGGGMDIGGPAIVLRKSFGETVSVSGRYYADMISGASIDVITTASPYKEQRDEYGVSVDYLRGKTTMNLGYARSSENDYLANTYSASVTQSMFGDLTTVNLGFSYGSDTISKTGDPDFERDANRKRYRLGVTQILTTSWLANLVVEAITDQGYLNNPYRSVRYLDPSVARGYSYQPEVYPQTRTSTAAALTSKWYLPYRAALAFNYRYFADTWDINAHNAELAYTHPLFDRYVVHIKGRFYSQNAASFYSDLFPYRDAQNYMARDKELSQYSNWSSGLGLTYKLPLERWTERAEGDIGLEWDFMRFDYDNFSDVRVQSAPGTEPGYSFSANVVRAFVSVYF